MGLDKEYESGGAFDRRSDGCHLDSRPGKEQLLGISCPRCGVSAGRWCDRSRDRGYLRSVRGLRLFAEGTPDSHQERKWAWQGHDPSEFAELWERERGGRASRAQGADTGEISMVIADVRCPVHGAERGAQCPEEPGVCKPRVQKWVKARDQKITRVQQRRSAARGRASRPGDGTRQVRGAGHARAAENHWADSAPDECTLCFLASRGVSVPDHDCPASGG